MSKAAWTPGPWIVRVAGPNNYPYAITAPDVPWGRAGAIRDITRWAAISMPSSAEGQANARLIAEAPAMAEAIERFIPALWLLATSGNADAVAMHDEARAILARINGEAGR